MYAICRSPAWHLKRWPLWLTSERGQVRGLHARHATPCRSNVASVSCHPEVQLSFWAAVQPETILFGLAAECVTLSIVQTLFRNTVVHLADFLPRSRSSPHGLNVVKWGRFDHLGSRGLLFCGTLKLWAQVRRCRVAKGEVCHLTLNKLCATNEKT